MIILAVRTDKPEAELHLFESRIELRSIKWEAHRELAKTIHRQIAKLLNRSSFSLQDIGGIVCYKGPGSFTGLRIGLSVGNALADAQNIPIIATKGEKWLERGINKLLSGKNEKLVVPFYGRPVKTTNPKK